MPLTKEQRAEISRANGRKSRGPITEKGKSFSSRNSLKHGFARPAIDPIFLEAERVRTEELLARLRPKTDSEADMVRQIASDQTRIRQIEIVEHQHLAAASTAIELGTVMMRFDRYKTKEENRYRRLLARLMDGRLRKNQQNEPGFSYKKQCVT